MGPEAPADSPGGEQAPPHSADARRQEGTRQPVTIYGPSTGCVSDFLAAKYEREAGKYWDLFYKRNRDRFFKDRHYLYHEWAQYLKPAEGTQGTPASRKHTVLELGCGAGNTVYPLLAESPDALFIHCCDFSPRAVDLVKAHPEYSDARVNAFVADVTTDDLSRNVPEGTVDAATMIFVLSAIAPEKMPRVLANLSTVLRPGGHVLFRDYAAGDLAQERLVAKEQKISDNFFARGDGTRAYYFPEVFLRRLFEEAGFVCLAIKVHETTVENRARGLQMDRKWVQAEFKWAPHGLAMPAGGGAEGGAATLAGAPGDGTSQRECCIERSASGQHDIERPPDTMSAESRSLELTDSTWTAAARRPTMGEPPVEPPVELRASEGAGERSAPASSSAEADTATDTGTGMASAADTGRCGAVGAPQARAGADTAPAPATGMAGEGDSARCGAVSAPQSRCAGANQVSLLQAASSSREASPAATKVRRQAREESGAVRDAVPLDMVGPEGLFREDRAPQVESVVLGQLTFRALSLPREQQHTEPQTGLLLWDSCRVLGAYLLAHPSITRGKAVLELGCGCLALPSLVAAACDAAAVVATDGDPEALCLLGENLQLNKGSLRRPASPDGGGGSKAPSRKINPCLLPWGPAMPADTRAAAVPDGEQPEKSAGIAAARNSTHGVPGAQRCHEGASAAPSRAATSAGCPGSAFEDARRHGCPSDPQLAQGFMDASQLLPRAYSVEEIVALSPGRLGFDVVLGADVVYSRHAIPLLFSTARGALRPTDSLRGGQQEGAGQAASEGVDQVNATASGGPGQEPGPVLLLCHVTRRVSEREIVQVGEEKGFQLVGAETVEYPHGISGDMAHEKSGAAGAGRRRARHQSTEVQCEEVSEPGSASGAGNVRDEGEMERTSFWDSYEDLPAGPFRLLRFCLMCEEGA